MSIYLPDDLHQRLERLRDYTNWSQVAQKAFELELRLHPDWSNDQMDAIIERLRASKRQQVDDVIQKGLEAGRDWAEKTASYKDLRIVAEKLEFPDDPDDVQYNTIAGALGEPAGDLFKPYYDEEHVTYTHIDPYFQIGFYRGAGQVWKEVKDKL
jgi:hypothetical protein